MTCQSVPNGYIINTASISAVKIVLPNPLKHMSCLCNVKQLLLLVLVFDSGSTHEAEKSESGNSLAQTLRVHSVISGLIILRIQDFRVAHYLQRTNFDLR